MAQLVMAGVDGSSIRDARRLVERDEPIGGLFLRGNDDEIFRTDALRLLIAGAAVAPLVAVDDEGGRVQRIDQLVGPIPSARQQAASLTPSEVQAIGVERGRQLASLGVTVDFAPVVDVSLQPDWAVIGDRSYGSTAATVTEFAGAFAAGLRSAGVLPTLKHFPGHGRATGDSHRSGVVSPGLDELRAVDLVPYRSLMREGPVAVMMGHVDVPGLTEPGLPASMSPAAYRLLRDELGFDGLVVTDELLDMGAVADRFSVQEAVIRAIAAGADVALIKRLPDPDALLTAMEAAVGDGRLPPARVDDALARVLLHKGCV